MKDSFIRELKRGKDRYGWGHYYVDQKNMKSWESGDIGISKLFQLVCENNEMPESVSGIHLNEKGEAIEKDGWISDEIEKDDFIRWLRGLGYRRL